MREVELIGDNSKLFVCREFPDAYEGKLPVLIMLHGFTGNSIESKFYFSRLSKKLAAAGIASVRFDFRGTGNSDGLFEEMTVESEISDALEILNLIYADERYDCERIGLLGFSMGGMVAMRIVGCHSEKISCCALWSPASDSEQLYKKILEDSRQIPGTDGYLDVDGFKISVKFLDSTRNSNPRKDIDKFEKPVLIIHGSEDKAVDCRLSVALKRVFTNAELQIIEGADHVYSSVIWGEKLLCNTLSFLKARLLSEF